MATLSDLPKLFAAKDWTTAERLLRKAAKSRKAPAEVHFNLGKVLEAQGRKAQAITFFKRAAALKPGYAAAWAEAGRMMMDTGDPAGALPLLEKAAKLDPDDPYAPRNIGRIAVRLGLWEKAEAVYAGQSDDEAVAMLYRCAAEQRRNSARAMLDEVLAQPARRPLALQMMVRTARGAIPRRLPPAAGPDATT